MPKSFEFQLVSKLFHDTFAGGMGGGGALFGAGGGLGGVQAPVIHSILKLENKSIQQNFLNELKINFEKYKDKLPSQLIKLLFHGSGKNGADPKLIYESEEGLDIRFANFGAYGQGTYFADNSAYSHPYAT